MKKAIVSVINDLVTDQRVHRTCNLLKDMGFDVLLVGRKQRNSLLLNPRRYSTKRMRLIFEKGPLFYFIFNLRLFFLLLFSKPDILMANDLDTLLPNYLVSKIKSVPLVYDSHEYFTAVPELANSPLKRNTWKLIERFVLKRMPSMITVNDSIAGIYNKEYGIQVSVVRNVPLLETQEIYRPKSKNELGIDPNKKIILLQGSGININRGAEEAVMAMEYVHNAVLLIIGSGDVMNELKRLSQKPAISGKVMFIDKLPLEELKQYTRLADIGLTLDKDTNLNYRYSLPNKLFDYIHAGVPALASSLPEIKRIVEKYKVGMISESHEPVQLAKSLNEMLNNEQQCNIWKENTKLAAAELCWEKEQNELKKVFTALA